MWTGELERNRRRAAAGAGVEQRPRILGDVPRGDHRLDQQPIDRLVFAFRRQSERGEVDLGVPLGEELVVGLEILDESGVEGDSCRLRPALQPLPKLPLATRRTLTTEDSENTEKLLRYRV